MTRASRPSDRPASRRAPDRTGLAGTTATSLRLADLAQHAALVALAHDDARLVLERDPRLDSERGRAPRILLYLFRRDEAAQYLRAG
jgi:ATP-dependent DNA helicase RecG